FPLRPLRSVSRPPASPTLCPYSTLFRSHNHELVRFYFQELSGYLKNNNCSYVKVDPNWIYKKYDKDVNEKMDYEAQDKLILIMRSEEHTSELQSRFDLVCRLLLEKKEEQ